LLKNLGASLFFIKNLLKISLFGKERKFKGPLKFDLVFSQDLNFLVKKVPNFLSLAKREKILGD